jgi:hypothetical protein
MRQPNDITTELLASGLTVAQTSLLMELVLSMSTGLSTGQGGANSALEKRRAWDRDRQAKKREAERKVKPSSTRLPVKSTGHPPESTGQSGGLDELCSDEEEKNRSLQGKIKKENKRGSRLLSCASLTDEFRSIAVKCGCPVDRVDRIWLEFVDYWADIPGTKGCKLNWSGTWRNRVRTVMERDGNGKSSNGHRADTSSGRATAREAHHVATMGAAALRYLEESKSARSGGDLSRGSDSAGGFDFGQQAKTSR